MKDDLIADIWTLVIEHIPEKHRKDLAADFVNTLLDYGIKESTLQSLLGVDAYLDTAIEYAVDGEEIVDEEEEYYDEDEE
jgi:carbamoylphosphate synthase small subunit